MTKNIDLNNLTKSQGYRVLGANEGDYSGWSVNNAGDFNGDGYVDLIVGAYGADPSSNLNQAGVSYVIFGKVSGFNDIDLMDDLLSTGKGFKITGAVASDYSGYSVSYAGDVNGDGLSDIIIGAYGADPDGRTTAGTSYVIFGKESGFNNINLASSLSSTQGFRVLGYSNGGYNGWSVSRAGDFNGDGYDDIVIGEYGANYDFSNGGASYVVFGKESGFSTIDLSKTDLSSTGQGFTLFGSVSGGYSVSYAGDVNGDGLSDIIIGDRDVSTSTGAAYVIFGNRTSFGDIDLRQDLTPTQGFSIYGDSTFDRCGNSVSGAGDINGDGYDDVIIGAQGVDQSEGRSSAGASYIIFGKESGFTNIYLRNDISASGVGFEILGAAASDQTGFSVSDIGDFNNDGYDDVIIGAYGADPDNTRNQAGISYIIYGKAFGFNNIDLASLTSIQGIKILGAIADDNSGISVAKTGDINGDGYDDVIIGAYGADPDNTRNQAGISYVIFGSESESFPTLNPTVAPSCPTAVPSVNPTAPTLSPTFQPSYIPTHNPSVTPTTPTVLPTITPSPPSFTPTLKPSTKPTFSPTTKPTAKPSILPTLSPNTQDNTLSDINLSSLSSSSGFKINGEATYDYSGFSVSDIGDFNGDGFGDLVIGSYKAGPNDAGISYVVFGKASGFNTLELSSITSSGQGFEITGEGTSTGSVGDYSGYSVSGAGDINGDGYADVIIGAYNANYAGTAYVIFGKGSGIADIALSSLAMPNGFKITGEESGDGFGWSVSSAGDINGDGNADVIIGATYGDIFSTKIDAGTSYVIYGKVSGFQDINVASLTTTQQGFKIFGANAGDFSGYSVSGAGDINKDGYDDFMIGAYRAAPYNKVSAGMVYVIFGKSSLFSDIDLVNGLSSSQGFEISGANANDLTGTSVSNAGDVNKDGYADILIGASDYTYSSRYACGATYVIFGKASPQDINLSNALTSSQGFVVYGSSSSDYSGYSVSAAGDIDKDGYSDILIGAYKANSNSGTDAGISYIIYGKASGFSPIDLYSFSSSQGIKISGASSSDYSGRSVSTAGDFDGDGYSDVIVGAYQADPTSSRSSAGISYLIFGGGREQAGVPTAKPTLSPTSDYIDIYVTSGGSYTGTSSKENFIVDSTQDTTITGNGGADMFTIKENMNVDTTITDFNEVNEIINLEDFTDISSTSDLIYSSANPATISFDNNQNLILQGVTSSELTSNNYIFYEDNGNDSLNKHTIQNLIIASVATVVGTCLLCCGVYGAYRFGKNLWPAAATEKMAESVVEFSDTTIKNPLPGGAGIGMVDVGGGDFGHA